MNLPLQGCTYDDFQFYIKDSQEIETVNDYEDLEYDLPDPEPWVGREL